ncbi:MAG: hypothetical protein M3Y13_10225 [Armatimonadota bacterium]|nr:hypothetical protein [Armatimonadota bacterium]
MGSPRKRRWLWGILALVVVAVPLLLTLIGAWTSPPHVRGVPVGRLAFLDADQPSEHTTMLRGLFLTQPRGPMRELVHETEPQDTDAGVRVWITQPTFSPDGTQIAFEEQLITLLEEKQSIVDQLWVMRLDDPKAKPRLLLDLTRHKMKQIVGMTWTDDSEAVVFLNDATRCTVMAVANPGLTQQPLEGCPPLQLSPDTSATRNPTLIQDGTLAYTTITPTGPQTIVGQHAIKDLQRYALSPDGRQMAGLTSERGNQIVIHGNGAVREVKARWGWSVFGQRKITGLRWSPDGRFLAYSVSKPPIPEDEIFYVDLATGRCFQLPVRAGSAGWDWGR